MPKGKVRQRKKRRRVSVTILPRNGSNEAVVISLPLG
jgi:hypothetical protein